MNSVRDAASALEKGVAIQDLGGLLAELLRSIAIDEERGENRFGLAPSTARRIADRILEGR